MTRSLVRAAARGFTLIEMLVALFIFGLLASASVVLLRQSVDAEAQSAVRLEEIAGLRRFSTLATQDLGGLVRRPSRDAIGNIRGAFAVGDSREALFAFARYAPVVDASDTRSSVQRVVYGFADGALTRAVAPVADGAELSDPVPVLRDLDRVALRYRDDKGVWQREWQPQKSDETPIAVELSLYPRGSTAPLVMAFLVGGGT